MNIYIIIPAHNEEAFIGLTLDSLIKQSIAPKKIVVVNDNSTDATASIVQTYSDTYSWIHLINKESSDRHIPGAKIIEAFYEGYKTLDDNYDVICKFDADLIFPVNYLETLIKHYENDDRLGMISGHCYIKKDNSWVIESLTSKDHIRGALKAYRKACFLDIGKLKPAMGWDTIDELLAKYYNWSFTTDDTLKVKHLKPTGSTYNKDSNYLQGEALYKLRFGFLLTLLSSAKLAFRKKRFQFFIDYMKGYFRASNSKIEYLITEDQGKFVRNYRWTTMRKKFF